MLLPVEFHSNSSFCDIQGPHKFSYISSCFSGILSSSQAELFIAQIDTIYIYIYIHTHTYMCVCA